MGRNESDAGCQRACEAELATWLRLNWSLAAQWQFSCVVARVPDGRRICVVHAVRRDPRWPAPFAWPALESLARALHGAAELDAVVPDIATEAPVHLAGAVC